VSDHWLPKVYTLVCYRWRINTNLPIWYIYQKDTHTVTIFYCIGMWQQIKVSIRHFHKHSFPVTYLSQLCLQNILHNNVAVNWGGREYGTQRSDTGIMREWYGTMDDSGVILVIQAILNSMIATKWIMSTHSHYTHLRQPHSMPGFPKLSPLWGEAGFYFGFTISLRLCPLAFASVSHRFKALFTTQHWRTISSLPVGSNSPFSTPYASYRSLRLACGYTSTWGSEASKPWPISAVSVKFRQAAA